MKTKMIFIAGIMLLIFSGIIYAEDLPDTVFPWGVYVASGMPDSQKDSMEKELGLNVINLAWNRNNSSVISYMDREMFVYPNAGPELNPPSDTINYFKYAEAFYTLIEAEDDELFFRFKEKVGSPSGNYWYYGSQTDTVILDNLAWYHRKYNKVIDSIHATEYYPSINMKIAQFVDDSLETTDTLALLFRDISGFGIDTSYITALSFYDSEEDTFYTDPVIVECNEFTLDKNRSVSYTIYSTGEAKLYIDYFKVPDQYGVLLIDERYWDDELIESAYYLFGTKRVAGWYMCDEPAPEQLRAYLYVDSLLQVVIRSITVNTISSYNEEGN